MRKIFYILLLLVIINSEILKAHQDNLCKRHNGNIYYQIKTGFCYEELNRVQLISELCKQLSQKLNFTDDIEIFFSHAYVGFSKPLYAMWTCSADLESLDRCLKFYVYEKTFDPQKILKLLEFGIQNFDFCDSNKVDSNIIKNILTSKTSSVVSEIIKQRTLLPQESCHENKNDSLNYYLYFSNNQYFLCFKWPSLNNNQIMSDTTLLILDNVYQYSILDSGFCLIFNTDSSFYLCSSKPTIKVSNIQVIESLSNYENFVWMYYYRPKVIKNLGNNKFSIDCGLGYKSRLDLNSYRNRYVIYNSKDNTLIQNANTDKK